MSRTPGTEHEALSLDERIDRICAPFEAACKAALVGGPWPSIEDSLGTIARPDRPALLRELVLLDVYHRQRGGKILEVKDYQSRFPELDPAWLVCAVSPLLAQGERPSLCETLPHRPALSVARPPEIENRPVDFIGKYRVVERLGRGGQAEVYRAVHPNLPGRDVVIKWASQTLPDPVRQQIIAEGRVLMRLEDLGLARVYDVDVHEGRPFLVIEYIPGRTLRDQLRERPPAPRDAAALALHLAHTLSRVHGQGILHRDLKPANILIAPAGQARILDFGLALMAQPWDEALPPEGQVSGTCQYMAPEQANGQSKRIGPWTDVFGLGAVLYEMLTGRPPYQAATAAEGWEQARRAEIIPPRQFNRQVSRHLERICLKALAADPKQRYASAAQMERALRGYLQRPRFLTAALGLAGLIGAVAMLLLWLAHPATTVTGNLRVLALEIEGYRGKPARPLGRIGRECLSMRQGDAVRLRATLSEPAYCYLIAFNPDGKDQLCHPENEGTSPVRSANLHFPSEGTRGFFLTEGSGLQAFVLVACRQPLPSYHEWKSRVGKLPWKQSDSDGVWHFDGEQFKPMGTDRGEVRDLELPAVFVDLCQVLRERSGAEMIEALAFPVQQPGRKNVE